MTSIVDELIAAVNKVNKKEVIFKGSDTRFSLSKIPTGVLPMDILFEGGVPKGRFSVLYGDYSTAKTVVAYCTIAQCQKAGGVAVLLDAEKAYDETWAKSLGIDTDSLILIRPDTGEDGLQTIATFMLSGRVDLVVVDSITALVPKTEWEATLEDQQPALLARLMSKSMRKLTAINQNTAVLWISQTRTNIGMSFGPKATVSGGNATSFYASHLVLMKKFGTVTEDLQTYTGDKWTNAKRTVVQKFVAEMTKSKLSKPFQQIYFSWDLQTAKFDVLGFVISQALEMGVITQKGAWWNLQLVDKDGVVTAEMKAQGQTKLREQLIENTQVYNQVVQMICDQYELDNIYAL